MKIKALCLFVAIFLCVLSIKGQAKGVEIYIELDQSFDSVEFHVWPVYNVQFSYDLVKYYKVKVENGKAKFVLSIEEPINFKIKNISKMTFLAEVGDSITIRSKNNELLFSGLGCDKLKMLYEVTKRESPKKPDNISHRAKSVDDYLQWYKYSNSEITDKLKVLERYKNVISLFSYKYYEAEFIIQSDYMKVQKFIYLIKDRNQIGLLSSDLINIFDSTFSTTSRRIMQFGDTASLSSIFDIYLLLYNSIDCARSYYFEPDHLDASWIRQVVKSYYYAKNIYSGRSRERLLTRILSFNMIENGGGLTEDALSCVDDYLQLPGYPDCKAWMRNYVLRRKTLSKDTQAPEFSLQDTAGRNVSLSEFKGKVVIIDFWFTGCKGCLSLTKALKGMESEILGDTNVVLLSISTDRDRERWVKSINEKRFTTGLGINLYTNGDGQNHPIINAYNIGSFPTLFLIDPMGAIIAETVPDPRVNGGREFVSIVKREIAELSDGPYVLYSNGQMITKYIDNSRNKNAIDVKVKSLTEKDSTSFLVNTDTPNDKFVVQLKKRLDIEASVYRSSGKIFTLSDIEGNFFALRRLLQKNKVIDGNYNWTFGDGHLVIVGDVFDRGEQVTECLWLIYSLEEKAKLRGGHVHFILGNHEILNMCGDERYLHYKYAETAKKLATPYITLYGESSELGRWLRTKNVVEKIGDVIFVHGGFSDEVNKLPYSITQINNMIRPYYALRDKFKESRANNELRILLSSKHSPFWYRGYYEANKNAIRIINSTLYKYDAQSIVTGHTIVDGGGKISMFYEGKLFNTDTRHAEGKSQALLIDNGKYYSVDCEGNRELLYNSFLYVQK